MYRLHCFAQSGNSYKVAFLLRALDQPFEMVFVDFMNGATREAPWREAVNEMGEAPVLEADGKRMTQSGAIMTYLARKHGAFGGATPDEQQEVLRWLLFDNHKFTSFFASYRFNRSFGPAAPDPAVMAWLKGRIDAAWSIADKHLAASPFMAGNAPTIADISLSGYLFYPMEESGYDIPANFPHIAAWLERVKAIPGWVAPYDLLPGERIAPRW
ncbi:MAG: glutathione S-transferase C-terminal domain-containing protein [Burkholderiales bacterium]|nr:glutathione S-transferase C-terminal domain-containing protein [Burkholderiales bacterium]